MLQQILKAEGNLAIGVLLGLAVGFLCLLAVPGDLIAFAVRFTAAMCTVLYATEKFGERLMSILKGESDVDTGSPEGDGGKDQDGVQES